MGKAEREAAAAARKEKRAANNERYRRKIAEIDEKKDRRLAEIRAKGEAQREQPPRPVPMAPAAASGPVELDFKGMLTVRGGKLELPNGQVQPLLNLTATVHWGPRNPEYTESLTGMLGAVPMLSKRHRFHHWLTIQSAAVPVFFLQIAKEDKPAAQEFAHRFNSLPRSLNIPS